MDEKIAAIVEGMRFERKRPVPSRQRAACASLHSGVSAAARDLNRLSLRLWHAVSRRAYHSLSLEETRLALRELARRLDALSREQ